EGEPVHLKPLPIQYADFAVWQRAYLSGERLEKSLAYWEGHLADAPALIELPLDKPRPAVQSYKGSHYAFQLPLALSEQLKALTQQANTTLFMTLLASFYVLLSRYTNQTDIVIGTPIAGRNRQEIEGLIGFFVNTLALRADVN